MTALQSDLSRFSLDDEDDIILYLLGSSWLKRSEGVGRVLPIHLIGVTMTLEEFMKKSDAPSTSN